jgi:hypothetical protein
VSPFNDTVRVLIFFLLFFGNLLNDLNAQEPVFDLVKDSTIILTADTLHLKGKNGFQLDSIPLTNRSVKPTMVFRDDSLLRSPWGAVGRSFIVPGWGQWYNDQPVKAAVFLVSDAGWMILYQKRNGTVRRIERQRMVIDRQIKTDPYLGAEQKRILQQRFQNLTVKLDQALNRRNLYGWLFALSHLLGMVDAFVDAHLYGFQDKMEMAVLPAQDRPGVALQITIK